MQTVRTVAFPLVIGGLAFVAAACSAAAGPGWTFHPIPAGASTTATRS